MRDSVLKRYALAYIKENGSDNGVQEFLRSCGMQNIENWSDKNFENAYKNLFKIFVIGEKRRREQSSVG